MKVINGKSLRSFGKFSIEGDAIVTSEPITLLGFVNPQEGTITEPGHELNGKSISGKIFVFPRGVGSTVGPYTLINLVKNGKGPMAIINRESDQGTIAGCSVARIPLVYGLELDPTQTISNGDKIKIESEKGYATITIVSK